MKQSRLIAKVAVEKLDFVNDILYSYAVPQNFENLISPGRRVVVPFGMYSSLRQGIIMGVETCEDSETSLKQIHTVLDKVPCVSAEMMDIIKWIKEYYFCTYFEAAKLVTPPGTTCKIDDMRYEFDAEKLSSQEITLPERELINEIKNQVGCEFSFKDLKKLKIPKFGLALTSLISKQVVKEKSNVLRTIGEKTFKVFSLQKNNNINEQKLTPKQKVICDYLAEHDFATQNEIHYFTGVGESVVKKLVKIGILNETTKNEYLSPKDYLSSSAKLTKNELSSEQKSAFESLFNTYMKNEYSVSLLHGITGSGKTEVILNLIDKVIEEGKSVIYMLPEIALTSQIIGVFKSRYSDLVTVIHSGLSDWQRLDSWKKINSGEKKVIIGTRSAALAPVQNLGLVVIDEEHEFTYKSESTPKFSAKEVAMYRCLKNNSMLLFSSATPSIETYFKAKSGNYHLVSLKTRYGKSKIPEVGIIDMRSEKYFGSQKEISESLAKELKNNFKNKKQSIIFLNRRGFSTFAKCVECGEVVMCPYCSVALNYHKDNNKLMCHYCGYSMNLSSDCPKCHSKKICYMGFGTQKIENILAEILPGAKILRIDADAKKSYKSIEKDLKDFSLGEYDVLVGTQMIAKGFNFPNVTLVGIISIDSYLYGSDYKSYEKTFSLLTQVIGRAGRGIYPGKAMIQTYSPEEEIITMASNQDYESFFDSEINLRKSLLYPPFSDICVLSFSGTSEDKVINFSNNFFGNLKNIARKYYSNLPLRILPPTPAVVKKVSSKYRYKIIIKCKNNKKFRRMISSILKDKSMAKSSLGVKIGVDINPEKIL